MGKYSDWATLRAEQINRIRAEGAAIAQTAASETPSPTIGELTEAFPEWKTGETYTKGFLFQYEGKTGFVRQSSVTASDVYPPFSTGTESLYGVRPAPDIYGVYPYVYNMAASEGMKVRDTDGTVYLCYQPIDPLLYPPSQAAAHFKKEETA